MPRTRPSPGDHGPSAIHEREDLKGAIAKEKKRLGAKLRALREARTWTRQQAAERVGIHEVHVARIEYGQANVTIATLVAMAHAYDVPLEELFRRKKTRVVPTSENSPGA